MPKASMSSPKSHAPILPSNAQRSIDSLLKHYLLDGVNLFGFLLDLNYTDCQLLTCDAWKIRANGAPQGMFVLLRLCPSILKSHPHLGHHLILCRILGNDPLPAKEEIVNTILQLHKMQVEPDPLTNAELQWCALKMSILGTYYDDPSAANSGGVSFGSDPDLLLSPHMYEAYVPIDQDLDFLLNLFLRNKPYASIGRLRYSESLAFRSLSNTHVMISPLDLIGFRVGILGMTRLGKSNLCKILADLLIRSGLKVGQLIIDPSGEYTYLNSQDKTSLYLMHQEKCVRFSLKPRLTEQERKLGLPIPRRFGVNFYQQVALGHAIIASLYDLKHSKRPDYINPLLNWEALNPEEIEESIAERGDQVRYRRSLSMYLALLHRARFPAPAGMTVELNLHRTLRQKLAADPELEVGISRVEKQGEIEIDERQTLPAASRIYQKLHFLHQESGSDTDLFPPSKRTGEPYFDLLQTTLLRMHGVTSISGASKFSPFLEYHDPQGSDVLKEIVELIDGGKTIILDVSNADSEIAHYYSDLVCTAILRHQVEKFARNQLGDHYVEFFFEEAHRLFPQDDRDLSNIYNLIAKEGAKHHIGMVYATQSIATISPDLLKNTENLFINHLNDEREIRELSRRFEFEEVARAIPRTKTAGFVRMISQSHRFVLPVQIHKFGPEMGRAPLRENVSRRPSDGL